MLAGFLETNNILFELGQLHDEVKIHFKKFQHRLGEGKTPTIIYAYVFSSVIWLTLSILTYNTNK